MAIKTNQITAVHVQSGTLIVGGTAADAAAVAGALPTSVDGNIEAEEIHAETVGDGFAWIAGHAPQNLNELRNEVARLRQELVNAMADCPGGGELAVSEKALAEAATPEPGVVDAVERGVSTLERATSLAGRVGESARKLWPWALALLKAARQLGGDVSVQ